MTLMTLDFTLLLEDCMKDMSGSLRRNDKRETTSSRAIAAPA